MYQAINEFTMDVPAGARSSEIDRTQLGADFAWRVLEEIDYGLILVSPDGKVQHANHLARHELARASFLRAERASIAGSTPQTTGEIMRGIRAAAHGRRQMINLRHGTAALPMACVPLFHPFEGESASVLLLLGRQVGTQNLALTFFARTHELTPAEECVLRALCDGMQVHDIAAARMDAWGLDRHDSSPGPGRQLTPGCDCVDPVGRPRRRRTNWEVERSAKSHIFWPCLDICNPGKLPQSPGLQELFHEIPARKNHLLAARVLLFCAVHSQNLAAMLDIAAECRPVAQCPSLSARWQAQEPGAGLVLIDWFAARGPAGSVFLANGYRLRRRHPANRRAA